MDDLQVSIDFHAVDHSSSNRNGSWNPSLRLGSQLMLCRQYKLVSATRMDPQHVSSVVSVLIEGIDCHFSWISLHQRHPTSTMGHGIRILSEGTVYFRILCHWGHRPLGLAFCSQCLVIYLRSCPPFRSKECKCITLESQVTEETNNNEFCSQPSLSLPSN